MALIAREIGDDPETWVWTAADSLFLSLVAQMHGRGMRVIIDGVFNHTGRDFFAFADLAAQQTASRFGSWYKVTSWDNPTTDSSEFDWVGWWGYKSLPEFADAEDQRTLAGGPAAYVQAITRRWMDPNGDGDPSDGIDGWRLDVATDIPSGFWRSWHQGVCSLNPSAYTVAEIWDASAEYLAETGFGGVMNYHDFAYPVKGFLMDATLMPSMLGDRMPAEGPTRLNLVDSHDTDQLASMIVNRRVGPYERADRLTMTMRRVTGAMRPTTSANPVRRIVRSSGWRCCCR
ncbi:MAG: alpha-amylase family glycosyl hydrolase [Bacteroidota bacterium]|nr:alpha-amylase family glycosyl hydrolase [Bacteroidota bacterium]